MIDIKNLSFSYKNGNDVVKNITFSVSSNEKIALLGANGAGKTTLLFTLLNLIKGNLKGDVFIKGNQLNKKNEKLIRDIVTLVFQNPSDQLVLPTVKEELEFFLKDSSEKNKECKIDEVLKKLGIQECKDKLIWHLSEGEKKKVALAVALIKNTDIILLDEPTGNLDPGGRRNLLDILKSLPYTMIITTHDLNFARSLCDRAVIIYKGEMVWSGKWDDFPEEKKLQIYGLL